MVFNATFNNISVWSWRSFFVWRKPQYPNWQTLSHYVVSSTTMSGIRTHNCSDDMHWLQK